MRYFNAQRKPSTMATVDFENLAMSHQSHLRQERRFQEGEEMRHNMGLMVGLVGGLSGFGTIVAVGAGALSAVALPVVLPVAAAVGVAGIASLVINKIATWGSRRKADGLDRDLNALHGEARRRGLSQDQVPSLPGLPNLAALAQRLDVQQARRDAETPVIAQPSVRRPAVG